MTYVLQRYGVFETDVSISLDNEHINIGRLAIPALKSGPNVSRKHASMFKTACAEWYVKDLNSTNGVFVNGIKIGCELMNVKIGDTVGFGAAIGKSENDFVFMLEKKNLDEIKSCEQNALSNLPILSEIKSVKSHTPISPESKVTESSLGVSSKVRNSPVVEDRVITVITLGGDSEDEECSKDTSNVTARPDTKTKSENDFILTLQKITLNNEIKSCEQNVLSNLPVHREMKGITKAHMPAIFLEPKVTGSSLGVSSKAKHSLVVEDGVITLSGDSEDEECSKNKNHLTARPDTWNEHAVDKFTSRKMLNEGASNVENQENDCYEITDSGWQFILGNLVDCNIEIRDMNQKKRIFQCESEEKVPLKQNSDEKAHQEVLSKSEMTDEDTSLLPTGALSKNNTVNDDNLSASKNYLGKNSDILYNLPVIDVEYKSDSNKDAIPFCEQNILDANQNIEKVTEDIFAAENKTEGSKTFKRQSFEEEEFSCSENIENITKYLNYGYDNSVTKKASADHKVSEEGATETKHGAHLFSESEETSDEAQCETFGQDENMLFNFKNSKNGELYEDVLQSHESHPNNPIKFYKKEKGKIDKRVILIEPKSMPSLARKFRSREEWSVEHRVSKTEKLKRSAYKGCEQQTSIPSHSTAAFSSSANPSCSIKRSKLELSQISNEKYVTTDCNNSFFSGNCDVSARKRKSKSHHAQRISQKKSNLIDLPSCTKNNFNCKSDHNMKSKNLSEVDMKLRHQNRFERLYENSSLSLTEKNSSESFSASVSSLNPSSHKFQRKEMPSQNQFNQYSKEFMKPSYFFLLKKVLSCNLSNMTGFETEISLQRQNKSSLNSYTNIFKTQLLNKIKNDISKVLNEKQFDEFHFIVTSHVVRDNIMILHCQTVFNSKMPQESYEESLLILDFKMDAFHYDILAFMFHCDFHRYTFDNENFHASLKQFPESKEQNALWCSFSLQILKPSYVSSPDKELKGRFLFCLTPSLNLADSLLSIKFSPLVQHIIMPSEEFFPYISQNPRILPTGFTKYNTDQLTAIKAICTDVMISFSTPRIFMLRGPPGTGKTATLVGIIQNILHESKKTKILVAAPSNAAVDEVGRQLITFKNHFVRVGLEEHIHNDIKPFSLHTLAFSTLRRKQQSKEEELIEYLSHVEATINAIKLEIASLKYNNKPETEIKEKKDRLMKYESFRKIYQNTLKNKVMKQTQFSEAKIYEFKLKILQEANVVLTTVNDCHEDILKDACKKKNGAHFSLCIIDESSNCSELETLQPLMYGMHKLLLIGDQKETLVKMTNATIKPLYSASLFERIQMCLNHIKKYNFVFTLTQQYRMHSEICSFPSLYFYVNGLKTHPSVDISYKNFVLKPYIFYDISSCKYSSFRESPTIQFEIEVALCICDQILTLCPGDHSIGIIIYDHMKVFEFESAFVNCPLKKNIEINAITEFNGRQQDIIIFFPSTISHHFENCRVLIPSTEELIIAITRARKCLIICGKKPLKQDHQWNTLFVNAIRRGCYQQINSIEDVSLPIKKMTNYSVSS